MTAFDPFGGETVNPALEAVKRLPDTIAGATIVRKAIPTVFGEAIDVLEETLAAELPALTLCIGQAGGRFDITVERVAINVDDARIEDNEGHQPIDVPIFKDGAPAYFARLPIKRMVQAIREEDLPASVSNSAGTFVCNHLMYGLLYLIEHKYPEMRGGFIHVPYLPKQVLHKPRKPSMSLADITRGLEAAVRVAVEHDKDIHVTGGAIS